MAIKMKLTRTFERIAKNPGKNEKRCSSYCATRRKA